MSISKLTRREFIRNTAASVAASTVFSSWVKFFPDRKTHATYADWAPPIDHDFDLKAMTAPSEPNGSSVRPLSTSNPFVGRSTTSRDIQASNGKSRYQDPQESRAAVKIIASKY